MRPAPGTRRKKPAAPRTGGRVGTRWPRGLLAALLLLVTLAAYAPAWHGGMVWDDNRHLTSPELRDLGGLGRIWFELGATQQYYPLAHSAFWLQHRLWGDDTTGYHLVNIALHALSALLVGALLRRLAVPGAMLAAVIFALHPVHVESVAWMTELKNTLSGALCLAAAYFYLGFDQTRSRRVYAASLASFALALLSKSVVATLPVSLLIVLWWRRGTLAWRRDVAPLTPFLALGLSAGAFTAWVERSIVGARGAEFQFSLVDRGLIAGRAFWFYLEKLVWPAQLTFVYPRWHVDASAWWQYLYPMAVVALLACLWLIRSRSRAPLAAALAFGVTLAPALGFVNVYPFRYSFVADHFQYLASIPVIALLAAGLTLSTRRWIRKPQPGDLSAAAREGARLAFGGAAVALAVVLGVLTWRQSAQYADAETLYRNTLRVNPECWLAEINLGVLLLDGRAEEAVTHFERALRSKADLPEARYNLGLAAHRAGRLDEAMGHYRAALGLSPERAEVHNNLGDVLRRLGRLDEAVKEGQAAVRLKPGLPEAHYNLATALRALGRLDEARQQYLEALRLGPDAAETRYHLASTLHAMGRLGEAVVHYTEAVRIRPDYPEAHNNLGSALQGLGRREEAMACFREALRIAPGYADAHYYLGNALLQAGHADEAAAEYRAALRTNPSDAAAHNNLGLALESLGRRSDAAAEYGEALRLRPDLVQPRDGLTRLGVRR